MFFPIWDFGHFVLILIRKLSHNPRSLDAAQKKDKKWSNSFSISLFSFFKRNNSLSFFILWFIRGFCCSCVAHSNVDYSIGLEEIKMVSLKLYRFALLKTKCRKRSEKSVLFWVEKLNFRDWIQSCPRDWPVNLENWADGFFLKKHFKIE
jgi:hypothetical protein